MDGETFRLGYVPGATPGKWARIWRERTSVPLELVMVDAGLLPAALFSGEVDAGLARLPVDRSVLSAIHLYDELSVVAVPKEHLLAALDDDETVALADLDDDAVFVPADDTLFTEGSAALPGLRLNAYRADGTSDPDLPAPAPSDAAEAMAWVGNGVGLTVLPMSLARLHHRKDVVYRVLANGPVSPVGLVWVADRTTEQVDMLIGIVRGRTANSSRGGSVAADGSQGGGPAAKAVGKVTGKATAKKPASGAAVKAGRKGAARSTSRKPTRKAPRKH